MKLLFDQNISFRVVSKLNAVFEGVTQVRLVGLEDSRDIEIWQYAKDNGYCIVTFDSDFFDLSVVKGIPPKIIWLRTGNLNTDRIAELLSKNREIITHFLEDIRYKEVVCLEL